VIPDARILEILLVEDNPGDVRLTREALKESWISTNLEVAGDGVEALQLLNGEKGKAPLRPDLILLDLNLPRMGGRELLAELKASPELRQIPVVVLSSSDAEDDVRSAYDLHANCYVVKPVALDRYLAAVRGIEQFWNSLVKLPGGGEGGGRISVRPF
jgi:two-component system, chemotaxis family, response regulator Rcp1